MLAAVAAIHSPKASAEDAFLRVCTVFILSGSVSAPLVWAEAAIAVPIEARMLPWRTLTKGQYMEIDTLLGHSQGDLRNPRRGIMFRDGRAETPLPKLDRRLDQEEISQRSEYQLDD